MQALRLARPRLPLRPACRSFAAAASSSPSHAASAASASSAEPVVPLSNVEAMWERLSADEQAVIHQQLEEIQKRDWKTLSVDEKKAGTCMREDTLYARKEACAPEPFLLTLATAYYVAFGPHGPRAPIDPPGAGPKIFLGVTGLIVAAGALFYAIRASGVYLCTAYVMSRVFNVTSQPLRPRRLSARSGRRRRTSVRSR